jgi:membrane-associated phospholipid phosphatase
VAILLILAPLFAVTPAAAAHPPDPVLDWISIMNDTVLSAGTNPLATSRVAALVSGSVYDAVNGIDPHSQPLFVKPNATHPASPRAAAIQAAYAILVHLYPLQVTNLAMHREASLTALAPYEKPAAIDNGISWGQTVADAIWAWRLTDGNAPPPPPFVGVLGVLPLPDGAWRPTPPANAPGAGPQFATMTPWVLTRPSLFRLPPPPALDSPQFAADLEEVADMGSRASSQRTADQSEFAFFWAGNTPLYWNRIASQLSRNAALSFRENARLFALLNVTMADAAIACWDSKYRYVFWRPITALRTGVTNVQTADPGWEPWLDALPLPGTPGTPPHPEYPSGHSTVSGSAAAILAAQFGENSSFTVTSEVRSGTRMFASFHDAVAEIANARVFGGIHYRTSCVRGNQLGQSVAAYVTANAFRPLDD